MSRFVTIRHCLISSFVLLIFSITSSCFAQEYEQSTTSAASTAPPNLETKLTQINTATIEFAEHRTTNAQATVVFENGLLLDLSTWKAVAAGLKQCCNLLFYNRPGVGRSTRGDADISPELERLTAIPITQRTRSPCALYFGWAFTRRPICTGIYKTISGSS